MNFRNPDEANGKTIGGMRMTAYVDLEALRSGRGAKQRDISDIYRPVLEAGIRS